MAKSEYKRILLKVSGEALSGDQSFGIQPAFLAKVAGQIAEVAKAGIGIAIVTGGGNIFRGMSLAAEGADRVTSDMMGTLGTIINSLALASALTKAFAAGHTDIVQTLRQQGARDPVDDIPIKLPGFP